MQEGELTQGARERGKRLAVFAACGIACALAIAAAREPLRHLYEEVAYRLDPTAERAYAYGDAHFDTLSRGAYDVERAQKWYVRATAEGAMLPYVHHQLSRTYFLQGDMERALAEIDAQVRLYGEATPEAYYVRALTLGFMGRYEESAAEFRHYLSFNPTNWAAANDAAWALLKHGRAEEAEGIVKAALRNFPDNPWLLNAGAIALYEVGAYGKALDRITAAAERVASLTPEEWFVAYPGNDPAIAKEGLAAFQEAVARNLATIEAGALLHDARP